MRRKALPLLVEWLADQPALDAGMDHQRPLFGATRLFKSTIHLVKLRPRLRVLVADKDGAFGRGVAYGRDDLQHLLNVPAGKMSAFANQVDHFLKWLDSRISRAVFVRNGFSSDCLFLSKRYLFFSNLYQLLAG